MTAQTGEVLLYKGKKSWMASFNYYKTDKTYG